MNGLVMVIALTVAMQFGPVLQWGGWALFAIVIGFYVKLRMSDPFRRIDRLIEENRKTLAALAEEKIRVMELTNRNDALNTQIAKLHGEYVELRGQFSALNVAYGKLGERFDKMQDDYKLEREKRDQEFQQWMKEKAQRGDL